MAATTLVSIDEYLRKTYQPDVEYVDGELKERPMVKRVHGRLQSLISMWFGSHEDEWGIEVAVEVRTRVSVSRVRLPDVVVDYAGHRPETLVDAPLIVIEILSPGDSYIETQRLALDYQSMGIQNIWLIDPESRTGRVCQGPVAGRGMRDAWIGVQRFTVAGTNIYLDLDALFARLDHVPSK